MSKADKDGWIRHRGGKCPVEVGTLIDIRCRDGLVRKGVPCGKDFTRTASIFWIHEGDGAEVMAYRLHKPAEQVEACSKPDPRDSAKRDSDYVCWMRDRITEIDATTQALTAERAELVQKLASEGFALIGRINELLTDAAQEHEDICDPKNWKHGDVLYCTSSDTTGKQFIEGSLYVFESYTDGCSVRVEQDSTGKPNGMMPYALRWHSRPSA